LGHSEVSSVKYPPSDAIPELDQRPQNDGKVASVGRAEKPWDVLDHDPSWSKLICHPGELEEESRACPTEASPTAGDGKVLTGEAAAEEVDLCANVGTPELSDVLGLRDVGPVALEDVSPVAIELALGDDVEAGPIEPKVKASNA
jgi:hypothetical protein